MTKKANQVLTENNPSEFWDYYTNITYTVDVKPNEYGKEINQQDKIMK